MFENRHVYSESQIMVPPYDFLDQPVSWIQMKGPRKDNTCKQAMNNTNYDSAAFTDIAYTSAALKNILQSQWNTIQKIQEMSVVKALIKDLYATKASVIIKINVRKTSKV